MKFDKEGDEKEQKAANGLQSFLNRISPKKRRTDRKVSCGVRYVHNLQ